MKILFVCSSNVCRSPYAEYVFRRMVEQSPVLSAAGITVSSSAVFNKSKVIFPKAADSLIREGFDRDYVMSHKPTFKWCDRDRFEQADIIIGMSRLHKLLTPAKYRKKFVTLSEVAEGKYVKIPDPFLYKSQEDYDKVMSVIKVYLQKYADSLEKKFASANGGSASRN